MSLGRVITLLLALPTAQAWCTSCCAHPRPALRAPRVAASSVPPSAEWLQGLLNPSKPPPKTRAALGTRRRPSEAVDLKDPSSWVSAESIKENLNLWLVLGAAALIFSQVATADIALWRGWSLPEILFRMPARALPVPSRPIPSRTRPGARARPARPLLTGRAPTPDARRC